MMKYYLDTVAVRRLGESLPRYVGTSFTSGFVVFEILSGITESEYGARKAAIRRLFASRMTIVPRLPIDLALNAFGLTTPPEVLCFDDLTSLADELAASTDYADFMVRSQKFQINIPWLKAFDQKLAAGFKKVFSQKTDDIREARAGDRTARFTADRRKAIAGMARFLFANFPTPVTVSSAGDLELRYDGSIGRFIDAWLGYYELRSNLLQDTSANDWSDILHASYLASETIESLFRMTKRSANSWIVLFLDPGCRSMILFRWPPATTHP